MAAKNECARTDTIFLHLSEVSKDTVSLMTGSVLNVTGFVLNMIGFVLNITRFVLNMTGSVLNMTGLYNWTLKFYSRSSALIALALFLPSSYLLELPFPHPDFIKRLCCCGRNVVICEFSFFLLTNKIEWALVYSPEALCLCSSYCCRYTLYNKTGSVDYGDTLWSRG